MSSGDSEGIAGGVANSSLKPSRDVPEAERTRSEYDDALEGGINSPVRDSYHDDAKQVKPKLSISGDVPKNGSQGTIEAKESLVVAGDAAPPVNDESKEVNSQDVIVEDKLGVQLDDEERVEYMYELANCQEILREAEGQKCEAELDSFIKTVVHLLDKLTKVSNAILRLFPFSRIPKSTQDIQETFISLLFHLHRAASDSHSWINELSYSMFLVDLRQAMKEDGKATKLKFNTGPRKVVSPSSEHERQILEATTAELLRSLCENLAAFSKDLRMVLEIMRIISNDELDEVHDAVSKFSGCAERWMRSNLGNIGPLRSQVYKFEMMLEMMLPVNTLSDALENFLDKGFPEIEEMFKDQEKRTQIESLAILTGAVFFSSITASTLTLSLAQKSTLYDLVNFFWFTSLVFSIGSVMNSLVAFTWQHSIFRKRGDEEQLPVLIAFWSRESPLYFFVVSALTFIVGLCLLAYASGQARWTSSVTAILTGLSLLGIVGTTAWFVVELYGHRSPSSDPDDLDHSDSDANLEAAFSRLTKLIPYSRKLDRTIFDSLSKLRSFLGITTRYIGNAIWYRTCVHRVDTDDPAKLESGLSEPHQELTTEEFEKLREEIIRNDFENMKKRSEESFLGRHIDLSATDSTSVSSKTPAVMKKLIGALKTLTAERIDIGDRFTYDEIGISISSDGNARGVIGSDACLLYQLSDMTTLPVILSPPVDEIFKKIVWSPLNDTLLLRTTNVIQVWRANKDSLEPEFILLNTIVMPYAANDEEYFAWYPNGDFFCYINGTSVKRYSTIGNNKSTLDGSLDFEAGSENHKFGGVFIIADTKDGFKFNHRLVISVTATDKMKRTSTAKSPEPRELHELIVYDVENRTVESHIPLFDRVQSLCLSKDESELLIGYVRKPPQLWDITNQESLELVPRKSYTYVTRTDPPRNETHKWTPGGQSFFLGPIDEFVVCWEYYSDRFQVWDKDAAVPLLLIESPSEAIGIRSIAHCSYLFASASFLGDVAVWRMPKKDVVSNNVEEQEGDDEGEDEDAGKGEISIVPR